MYSLAWLVVVGVICAVLGGGLGHLVARVRSKAAARIQELEAQLESARGENSGYRREVFDQFAETARKFKNLDESYNDLHRHLAASASLLCGDAAGPLLDAPAPHAALSPDGRQEERQEERQVAEEAAAEAADGSDETVAKSPATDADAADTAADTPDAATAEQTVGESAAGEDQSATEPAESDPESAADSDRDVPILVAEVDDAERESESEDGEAQPQPRRAEGGA